MANCSCFKSGFEQLSCQLGSLFGPTECEKQIQVQSTPFVSGGNFPTDPRFQENLLVTQSQSSTGVGAGSRASSQQLQSRFEDNPRLKTTVTQTPTGVIRQTTSVSPTGNIRQTSSIQNVQSNIQSSTNKRGGQQSVSTCDADCGSLGTIQMMICNAKKVLSTCDKEPGLTSGGGLSNKGWLLIAGVGLSIFIIRRYF